MHAVVKSAQAVAYYCPKVFHNRRWNCSSIEHLPTVTPDLSRGTREQAIVHALASGALVFEIARRCSMDKIANCNCGQDDWSMLTSSNDDKVPRSQDSKSNYVWNGCADNVQIAKAYTRSFLGHNRMKFGRLIKRKRKRNTNMHYARLMKRNSPVGHDPSMPNTTVMTQLPNINRMLNGHNYGVGIYLMEQNRKLTCKCHGVSGSCTNKVCFRQFLRLDSPLLQRKFRESYLTSKLVSLDPVSRQLLANEYRDHGRYKYAPLMYGDLGFTEHSSDYCDYDSVKGSVGTYGRLCRSTEAGPHVVGNCDHMCCDRGTYKVNVTKTISCNCRMSQNFNVVCDKCLNNSIREYCI